MVTQRLLAGMVMAWCLLVCGCWKPAYDDPTYHADTALATLLTALEAWKQNAVGQLAQQTPPIRFVDEDHRAGARLQKFELLDAQRPIRPFQGVRVKLTLQHRSGTVVETVGMYQITLEPLPSVIRSDP